MRNDAHIQNIIQNVGIRKQEDLYKSISLIGFIWRRSGVTLLISNNNNINNRF